MINIKQTIGSKIKKLRKEQKMTQAELAGNQISKSMLSLIENNMAVPSIKTLKYIAEKLNKPVSYFIETNHNPKERISYDFPAKLLTQVNELINSIEYLSIEEIKKHMDELTNSFDDTNIIHADVLTKFGAILMLFSCYDKSEEYLLKAVDIYERKNLYTHAAKVYLYIHNKYYHLYDFDKCKEIIDAAATIYDKAINKDYILEIRLLYQKADFLMLTGASNLQIINTINRAISLSFKNNMFSLESLYRLKAIHSLGVGNYSEFRNNIDKSLNLCQITNSDALSAVLNTIAVGENILGDSNVALKAIENFEDIYNSRKQAYHSSIKHKYAKSYQSIINANMWNLNITRIIFSCLMEKAKSYLRLKDYSKALEIASSIDFDSFSSELTFGPDKVFLWKEKVYYALILSKTSKYNKAINIIDTCIKNLAPYNCSKELYFAYKCQSEIYSHNNEYEKAFNSLKKAEQYINKDDKDSYIVY